VFKPFERRLGFIPRWGIVPHINRQSVAEHSYYVALYADKICRMKGVQPNIRAGAVAYALRHDAAESMHGDIPSPAKKRMLGPGNIAAEDEKFKNEYTAEDYDDHFPPGEAFIIKSVVALADRLDAAMWLKQEYDMGNKHVELLLGDLTEQTIVAAKKLFPEEEANQFFFYIQNSTRLDVPE
jgi:5'-deoxynucleotidase YfbR-like HD superfamily hydrolase